TDMNHVEYAHKFAIDIPGEETDAFAETARKFNAFLVASAKARMEEFPDLFFNVVFLIDPTGKVIHKHYKNQVWVKEHSTTPHDLYDYWIKRFGEGLNAFFPVAKTDIGNIGTTICMEGSFPEIYRGLALNGAELVTRPSFPQPWVSQGIFDIQNRARALDNNIYIVSPMPIFGGAEVIDYRGQYLDRNSHSGEWWAAGIIDIQALREFRSQARFINWLPHIRTEIYRCIYADAIWPKNLAAGRPPGGHKEVEDVFQHCIRGLEKQMRSQQER
ncbi:MAG: hydrolase, partial [Nitrososphaerota archaeon]|nr:hydrolase [Nitrososphaerota archaeon]